jgi:hypothetical protein
MQPIMCRHGVFHRWIACAVPSCPACWFVCMILHAGDAMCRCNIQGAAFASLPRVLPFTLPPVHSMTVINESVTSTSTPITLNEGPIHPSHPRRAMPATRVTGKLQALGFGAQNGLAWQVRPNQMGVLYCIKRDQMSYGADSRRCMYRFFCLGCSIVTM